MLTPTDEAIDDQPPKHSGLSSCWLLNTISLALILVVALVGIQIFDPGGYAGLVIRIFPPPVYHGATVFAITPSDQIVALRATNGQTIWQHALVVGHHPVQFLDGRDGIGSFATDSAVQAFDMHTGAIRWHYEMPSTNRDVQAQNGMIVISEHFPPDQQVVLQITALSERDGTLRWQTAIPQPTGDYGMTMRMFAQGIYVILNTGAEYSAMTIFMIDPLTGTLRWHISLPSVSQDHPIALDAQDGIVAVRLDDALLAFDNTIGAQIWRVPMQGISHTGDPILTCVINQGNVYSINLNRQPSSSNDLVALSARTGAIRWHINLPPAPNWTYRLQVVNDISLAVLFPEGGEIHSRADGTRQWTFTGYLANGNQNTILIWDATEIQARNSADGTLRWHLNANDTAPYSIYQTNTMLYLSNGAWLRALDPTTGKVHWNLPQSFSDIIFATN